MPDEDRREGALIRILERCLVNRRYRNRRGGGQLFRWNPPPRQQPSTELTDKELLILKGLSHGLSLVETADVTGFKFQMCKTAMRRIKRKLRAKTRAQAVANAMRQGLIP